MTNALSAGKQSCAVAVLRIKDLSGAGNAVFLIFEQGLDFQNLPDG